MFKCTCGYPTCKEEYKTEEARERHLRGVLAAETKKELAKSDGDKPITSKTKSGKGHENWSEVAKRAARTRKRNNISKKLFGKKYKELSLDDKQKVDTELQDESTPEPMTQEESPRQKAPEKSLMSGKLATEATKLRILQIDNKNEAPRTQFVEFTGPKGGESNGIVDLLAIKKNHDQEKTKNIGCNVNDLLDIIHIQVKGGDSSSPTPDDKRRMKIVSKYYQCRETLLSEWNPARYSEVKFSRLNPQNEWERVDGETIFGKKRIK